MIRKLFLYILLCFIIASPIYAVRSLPAGLQPEPVEGKAVGNFTFQGSFSGTGTLYFVNTGGDAELTTVCDMTTVDTASGERCEGLFLKGSFTGGPYGAAIFTTESGGELKFQLADGKVFSFATQGITMNFNVTDPSIFDDWVEVKETRDSGARVSDLSGQVEIACPPDLEAWDVMKMGRVILIDCHLKTGEDSKAVISFSDMTTFEMKPETEIVIDTPPQKDSKWKLLVGDIWVNVKQMVKNGTMKVHMSQAVAGIKGTRFHLTENGTESKIEVIEGTVTFQSIANGEEITVTAGETVKATSAGLSEKTTFDTSFEQENWQEKINQTENEFTKRNNKNLKIIYPAGSAVIILIIVGIVLISRRKQAKKN